MSINVIVGVLFLAVLALAGACGYLQWVIHGLQTEVTDAQAAIDAHLVIDHNYPVDYK